MKLAKLSLATMLALGTTAFAADTLADAFKDGKLKGALQAYYFDRDLGGSKSADILTFGVDMDYETAAFYGFKLGAGFQSSSAPFADEEAKTTTGATLGKDMYGSGGVLSQAYIAYTISKTDIKIGRQYMSIPLLKSSGSRMTKQSFEGATIISKDLPKTTLYAGYIQKFQNRTDNAGNIGEFEDMAGDGAYAIGVENKSLPGTTLLAAYGDADESHSLYLLEAKYAGKAESFTYNVGAQYSDTDYDNAATADGSYYGLKVGMGMNGLKAYIAYAEVKDGTAKYAVEGAGAATTIFTTAVTQAGYYKPSEQMSADVNYNFKDLGILVGARYVDIDIENTSDDMARMAAYASYKFGGQLKGLSTLLQYEATDIDNADDQSELRFKVNYKF